MVDVTQCATTLIDMFNAEIGSRVGALMSSEDGVIHFFGYGVYEGRHVPVDAVGPMADVMREVGANSPRIKLDDGQVIYGCECWWAAEDKIRAIYAKASKVILVSIDDVRAKAATDRSGQDSR